MTKHDKQTMPMLAVQIDTKKPSTTQTTYHNPLSQLCFGIHYELVFNQQVPFVLKHDSIREAQQRLVGSES
jgi:hypothetical protein